MSTSCEKAMKEKGHKPKGPHGRAADRAIGQTRTTGRFKEIEKKEGKGAAINAYQTKLRKYKEEK